MTSLGNGNESLSFVCTSVVRNNLLFKQIGLQNSSAESHTCKMLLILDSCWERWMTWSEGIGFCCHRTWVGSLVPVLLPGTSGEDSSWFRFQHFKTVKKISFGTIWWMSKLFQCQRKRTEFISSATGQVKIHSQWTKWAASGWKAAKRSCQEQGTLRDWDCC